MATSQPSSVTAAGACLPAVPLSATTAVATVAQDQDGSSLLWYLQLVCTVNLLAMALLCGSSFSPEPAELISGCSPMLAGFIFGTVGVASALALIALQCLSYEPSQDVSIINKTVTPLPLISIPTTQPLKLSPVTERPLLQTAPAIPLSETQLNDFLKKVDPTKGDEIAVCLRAFFVRDLKPLSFIIIEKTVAEGLVEGTWLDTLWLRHAATVYHLLQRSPPSCTPAYCANYFRKIYGDMNRQNPLRESEKNALCPIVDLATILPLLSRESTLLTSDEVIALTGLIIYTQKETPVTAPLGNILLEAMATNGLVEGNYLDIIWTLRPDILTQMIRSSQSDPSYLPQYGHIWEKIYSPNKTAYRPSEKNALLALPLIPDHAAALLADLEPNQDETFIWHLIRIVSEPHGGRLVWSYFIYAIGNEPWVKRHPQIVIGMLEKSDCTILTAQERIALATIGLAPDTDPELGDAIALFLSPPKKNNPSTSSEGQ